MRKKVLFCATVDYHFQAFHLPYMRWFQEQGWDVHVAAAGSLALPYTNEKYDIPMQRSPFHRKNVQAYRQLKGIIEKNQYDIIHCHTPMGGVLARLAARHARRSGTKVIYTAHGFHFCKGAPLTNWLFYYPIERGLAYYTDYLITINEEDYNRAVRHRFQAGTIQHIHGVGVDTERFQPVYEADRARRRKEYGYGADDFLLFYAAEFNANKNQQLLIHALACIKEDAPNAKLLLAGTGPLQDECRKQAEQLGVSHMVEFLGYRNDIDRLLPLCNAAVASSLREGLPVNIMEAMACGLPVIAVKNRGHNELVTDGKTGWLVGYYDVIGMAEKMRVLSADARLAERMGRAGRAVIQQRYTVQYVLEEKRHMYMSLMNTMEEHIWNVQ